MDVVAVPPSHLGIDPGWPTFGGCSGCKATIVGSTLLLFGFNLRKNGSRFSCSDLQESVFWSVSCIPTEAGSVNISREVPPCLFFCPDLSLLFTVDNPLVHYHFKCFHRKPLPTPDYTTIITWLWNIIKTSPKGTQGTSLSPSHPNNDLSSRKSATRYIHATKLLNAHPPPHISFTQPNINLSQRTSILLRTQSSARATRDHHVPALQQPTEPTGPRLPQRHLQHVPAVEESVPLRRSPVPAGLWPDDLG